MFMLKTTSAYAHEPIARAQKPPSKRAWHRHIDRKEEKEGSRNPARQESSEPVAIAQHGDHAENNDQRIKRQKPDGTNEPELFG